MGFCFAFFLGCIETGRSLTVQAVAARVCSLHLVHGSLAVPFTASLGSGKLETDGAAKLALSPGLSVCWVRAMSFNRDKALEGKGGWHFKQI